MVFVKEKYSTHILGHFMAFLGPRDRHRALTWSKRSTKTSFLTFNNINRVKNLKRLWLLLLQTSTLCLHGHCLALSILNTNETYWTSPDFHHCLPQKTYIRIVFVITYPEPRPSIGNVFPRYTCPEPLFYVHYSSIVLIGLTYEIFPSVLANQYLCNRWF